MTARILIADDAELVRVALRELLISEAQYEVVEAENGKEAVLKTLETRPDLVIMDLAMPDMDGLTATREITKALPNLPILMYTLHCSAQLEAEARRLGVWKLLPKSESQALLSAVRDLLNPEMEVRLAS